MKNLFNLLLLSLFFSLSLFSCSSEDIVLNQEEPETFSFEISVPSELRTRADGTRAYGDGSSISELKYYVYSQADGSNSSPFLSGSVTLQTIDGKRGGKLSVQLPTVGAYDIVFLATACNQNNVNSKIYYNPEARSVNADYTKFRGNDEDADCFLAVLTDISKDSGYAHTVALKRVMAQLNIGTKDLADYNALASSPLKTVSVSVDGVYTAMDAMTGKVTGQPVKVSLPAVAPPTGQSFPVSGHDYLAMTYLLVNERKDVDVAVTAANATSSFVTEAKAVPVQRNHQTNVYGSLMTAANDIKVEINPGFGGSENGELETGPKEYDLILKLSSSFPSSYNYTSFLNIEYTNHDGSQKVIDLKPYIDSDNYVKVSWSMLGIKDPIHVRLHAFESDRNYIQSVEKCDINKFSLTTIDHFFCGLNYLRDVPAIKEWDTSNITDMSYLFDDCQNLQRVDLSGFDTSKVTNMANMFYYCENLSTLDLSKFDTSNVTDMSGMFFECRNVMSLDVSKFDTSNVTDMSGMFFECRKVRSLDVSKFDTSNVTDMSYMFNGCYYPTELDVSGFDTSKVTNMKSMFLGCQKLTGLNLSGFDTSKVTDMSNMFNGCNNLKNLTLPELFDTSKVTDMSRMFMQCYKIPSLVLGFDTSNVTNMSYMFEGCIELRTLILSDFDTSKVTDMSKMFWQCYNLRFLNLSNFDTSNVTDMSYMFDWCDMLSTLNISNFDTSNVTSMENMFRGCPKLKELNISGFNTSNVTNMSHMFGEMESLEFIDLSNFDTSNVTDMSSMFSYCIGLKSLDLSNFETYKVTNMAFMFESCTEIASLDLSSFNTANVTSMQSMFRSCENLSTLDLSNFTDEKLLFTDNMFNDCKNLMNINLSGLKIRDDVGMFDNCPAQVIWKNP